MAVTIEQLDAAFDATLAEYDTDIFRDCFRDCWAEMRKRLVAIDTEQLRQTAEWQAEFRALGVARRQLKETKTG